MLTNFVRSTGSRTRDMWRLIEKVTRADMSTPPLKKHYPIVQGESLFTLTHIFTEPLSTL